MLKLIETIKKQPNKKYRYQFFVVSTYVVPLNEFRYYKSCSNKTYAKKIIEDYIIKCNNRWRKALNGEDLIKPGYKFMISKMPYAFGESVCDEIYVYDK